VLTAPSSRQVQPGDICRVALWSSNCRVLARLGDSCLLNQAQIYQQSPITTHEAVDRCRGKFESGVRARISRIVGSHAAPKTRSLSSIVLGRRTNLRRGAACCAGNPTRTRIVHMHAGYKGRIRVPSFEVGRFLVATSPFTTTDLRPTQQQNYQQSSPTTHCKLEVCKVRRV
jgi:hypothetical protein